MFSRFFQKEPAALSQRAALSDLRRLGVDVATVIDVGAAEGAWSAMASDFWPEAAFHLIEAKERWRPRLDAFCAGGPKMTYAIAGVTDAPGTAFFEPGDDAFG
ncbi:MAG: FkbM family methyltransferase, partial [Pseudomonadota bacterium]